NWGYQVDHVADLHVTANSVLSFTSVVSRISALYNLND
ncbi:BgTH12-05496, partial [Blumeria graminis f. sp. triticale]